MIKHHVVSDDAYAALDGVKGLKGICIHNLGFQRRTVTQLATHFTGVCAPCCSGELKALARPTVDADDAVP
jgi:hypothetical protein